MSLANQPLEENPFSPPEPSLHSPDEDLELDRFKMLYGEGIKRFLQQNSGPPDLLMDRFFAESSIFSSPPNSDEQRSFLAIYQEVQIEQQQLQAKEYLFQQVTQKLNTATYLSDKDKYDYHTFYKKRKEELPLSQFQAEVEMFLDEDQIKNDFDGRNLGFLKNLYLKFKAQIQKLANKNIEDPEIQDLANKFDHASATEKITLFDRLKQLLKQKGLEDQEDLENQEREDFIKRIEQALQDDPTMHPTTKIKWLKHFRQSYLKDKIPLSRMKAEVENFLSSTVNSNYNERNLAFYRKQYHDFHKALEAFQSKHPDFPIDKLDLIKQSFQNEPSGSAREKLAKEFRLVTQEWENSKKIEAKEANTQAARLYSQILSTLDKSPYLSQKTKDRSKKIYEKKYQGKPGKAILADIKRDHKDITNPIKTTRIRNIAVYKEQYEDFHDTIKQIKKNAPDLAATFKNQIKTFNAEGYHERKAIAATTNKQYLAHLKAQADSQKTIETARQYHLQRIAQQLRKAPYLSPKTKKRYVEFFQKRYQDPSITPAQMQKDFSLFTSNQADDKIKNLQSYKNQYDQFQAILLEKQLNSSPEDQKKLDDLANKFQDTGWTARAKLLKQLRQFKTTPQEAISEIIDQAEQDPKAEQEQEPQIQEIAQDILEEIDEETSTPEQPLEARHPEQDLDRPETNPQSERQQPPEPENLEAPEPEPQAELDPQPDLEPELQTLLDQQPEPDPEELQTEADEPDIETQSPAQPNFIDAFSSRINLNKLKDQLGVNYQLANQRTQQLMQTDSFINLTRDYQQTLIPFIFSLTAQLSKQQFQQLLAPHQAGTLTSQETLDQILNNPDIQTALQNTQQQNNQTWILFRDTLPLLKYNPDSQQPEQIEEITLADEQELTEPQPEPSQEIQEAQEPDLQPEPDPEELLLEPEPIPELDTPLQEQTSELDEIQETEAEQLQEEPTTPEEQEQTIQIEENPLPPELVQLIEEPDIFDQIQDDTPLDIDQLDTDYTEEIRQTLDTSDTIKISEKLIDKIFSGELNNLPYPVLSKLINLSLHKQAIKRTVKKIEQTKSLSFEQTALPLFLMFASIYKIGKTTSLQDFLRSFLNFTTNYLALQLKPQINCPTNLLHLSPKRPLQLFKTLMNCAVNSTKITELTFTVTEQARYMEIVRTDIHFSTGAHSCTAEAILVTADYLKMVQ